MNKPRVSLYDRLPEIYRIKDAEQNPPFLLKNYLGLMEEAFGAIDENIETLYHNLFIETCDEWVVPYIADLLGTSHLKGDPWTLRADVADTIALRRRKGTLRAIELLAYDLTRWGCRAKELRDNLVWAQHLNHQRPDEGGQPPYSLPSVNRFTPLQGGTIPVRHPGELAMLTTPFDPFGHLPDLKPAELQAIRYNLPNLALYLWRLEPYTVNVSWPKANGITPSKTAALLDTRLVKYFIHPLAEPVQLFNPRRFDTHQTPPILISEDAVPGPLHPSRLTTGSPVGHPEEYVSVDPYDPTDPALPTLDISPLGLQLHVPQAQFANQTWTFRGANLCAWEKGLDSPLDQFEIAIDPIRGRLLVSVANDPQANALVANLLLTYTYAAVGPVGAHPLNRASLVSPPRVVNDPLNLDPLALTKALANLQNEPASLVIEIQDSRVHDLDLSSVTGVSHDDSGGPSLVLSHALTIRAADNQRPIIRLAKPLRFRPVKVKGASPTEQKQLNADMEQLTVRLEGLYLTLNPSANLNTPLIARTAINALELVNCTLDPGGFEKPDGTRAPMHKALELKNDYGFNPASGELPVFNQLPQIILQRTIAGQLLIDTGYTLFLNDTILDAGKGVGQDPGIAAKDFALSGPVDPATGWGPVTQVNGVTVFGRMRVERLSGRGGIWVQTLEVENNQIGCIKYSYFSGQADRLPQNHACVWGPETLLQFTSEYFGSPAYGQLSRASDDAIRQQGPNEDAMGAFGFLLEAHKWRNLKVRFREFMPVGIRPLLISIT